MPTTEAVAVSALIGVATLVGLAGCGSPDAGNTGSEQTLPAGDYLEQVPPGSEPRLFAPGIVNTGLPVRDMTITPDGDEIFFSASIGRNAVATIVQVRRVAGRWQPPRVAPFAEDAGYMSIEPALSPDGSQLFFASDRPREGHSGKPTDSDIWVVERRARGWGPPEPLGAPVNSEGEEFFPSPTEDGTLYFTRRPGLTCREGILRSKRIDGVYQEPEELPAPINAAARQFNAFVDPGQRYLIIPAAREDSLGGYDYYISFRSDDDRWSELIHLGAPVSHENRYEWSAYVTGDERFLFFMSARSTAAIPETLTWSSLQRLHQTPGAGSSSLYWVDASFLAGLRAQARWPSE
jgi:hypothetical protein